MVEQDKIIDKKIIPTIISIGILIVLSILILPDLLGGKTSINNVQNQNFLNLDTKKVNYLKIDVPDLKVMNIELLKDKNGKWSVNGLPAYTADVNVMLMGISQAKILSKVSDYSYLREFGLDPPKKILTIGFNDQGKSKIKALIGDSTPTTYKRYAKYVGNKEIYIVDPVIYSSLATSPEALWDKDIFGMDENKVKQVIIADKKNRFLLSKQDDAWYVTINQNKELYADQETIIGIINSLFKNSAFAVVEYDSKNLSKYKLSDPILKIQANDADDKVVNTEIFARIPSTKFHYALNKSNNNVYLLDDTLVKQLLIKDYDLRNKKLVTVPLSKLTSVIVNKGSSEYKFFKSSNTLWDCKNAKLEQPQINKYIEDLTTLYVDVLTNAYISNNSDKYGFDRPILKLSFYENNNNDKPFVISIGKKGLKDQYYLQINNDPYLYMIKQEKFQFINNFGQKI